MPYPSFALPWFAIAGLVAALGPVVIHLLNRRRFRVVHWAAMDFLRQAVQRSRRMLRLRDLLLMALRMLCLAAFGAALARPLWNRTGAPVAGPNQPVHAVVLLDNSLSMGYEKLDGTLWDDAKAKAKELIERLPRGSQVSVLPTCGSPRAVRYEPYATAEDALEALAAIPVADRAARPDAVVDLALDACRLATLTPKRIVLVAGRQTTSWPAASMAEHLKQLPAPLEIVPVAADVWENAWIADFKLRDGIADLGTPGTFVATIGYQGPAPRRQEVTLSIEGVAVASVAVDLQPGQRRDVEFPPYRFDVSLREGAASYVTAEVSMPHDRLPLDDQRYLVVPVVTALPVLFVDTLGSEEDPRQNRYGETYFLRRLLAPHTTREAQRQLVEVRQRKIDELTKNVLADTRLVVIAGVPSPGGAASLLREYVEQGGNLLIAAGGQFDPAAWTAAAWADGQGILPAPLAPSPVGRLPEETTGQLEPFFLDPDTLVHDYFLAEGTPPEELRAMYGPRVLFFKAVAAQLDDEHQQQAVGRAAEYFRQQARGLEDIGRREAELKTSDPDYADRRAALQRERSAVEPRWLLWKAADEGEHAAPSIENLAERARPQVLGRFTNGLPLLVRRGWGRGQVLFLSTSVSTGWNRLAIEKQAAWVYDRILRSLLGESFPRRNLSTEDSLVLPVAPAERLARFTLEEHAGGDGSTGKASGTHRTLSVDALGSDRYGIVLGNWPRRGIYRVIAAEAQDSRQEGPQRRLWELPLAVNGPAEASDLGTDRPAAAAAGAAVGWASAASAGTVSIASQTADLSSGLLLGVLAGLLLELAVLARYSRRGEPAA